MDEDMMGGGVPPPRAPQKVELPLKASLDELYKGATKKMKVTYHGLIQHYCGTNLRGSCRT